MTPDQPTAPDRPTERVPLGALQEDPDNARRHDDKNLKAIRDSLKEFGQVEPLVVQKGTYRLIAGHGRLQVMRELGLDMADVVALDVTDTQARALGLALNRSAELGEWDPDGLERLLGELRGHDYDLTELGFDAKDLEALLGGEQEAFTPDDDVVELPKVAPLPPPEPPAQPAPQPPAYSPVAQVAQPPPAGDDGSPQRYVTVEVLLDEADAEELTRQLKVVEEQGGQDRLALAIYQAVRTLTAELVGPKVVPQPPPGEAAQNDVKPVDMAAIAESQPSGYISGQ